MANCTDMIVWVENFILHIYIILSIKLKEVI